MSKVGLDNLTLTEYIETRESSNKCPWQVQVNRWWNKYHKDKERQ